MDVIDSTTAFQHAPTHTQISITLRPDSDNSPSDYDCYSPEDVAAFQLGNWQFVTVEVIVSCHGAEVGSDVIGGVEHGDPSDDVRWNALDPKHGTTKDCIEAALSEADGLAELFRCASDGHLPVGLVAAREWLASL
jgi:hypothetical protein